MKLLKQDETFKLYQIQDKQFTVFDSWLRLNNYSLAGEPLGKGMYMSSFQQNKSNNLVKEYIDEIRLSN
jgi:hypothetical protein